MIPENQTLPQDLVPGDLVLSVLYPPEETWGCDEKLCLVLSVRRSTGHWLVTMLTGGSVVKSWAYFYVLVRRRECS